MRNGLSPLSRLRVLALATAQALVDARPDAARAIRGVIPRRIWRRLRRLAAPVRIPEPDPAARVALDALDPFAPVEAPAGVPRASIVIPVRGGSAHTRLCLAAIRHHTRAPPYEVLVVDDGSTDDTADLLERLAAGWPALRRIESTGRGFAAAANAGARAAKGDVLVFLNNDTVPTPGWLAGLVAALDADASLGIVGATSNETGDLATVEASYDTLEALVAFAADRARTHAGRVRDLEKISLFCAAIARHTFEAAGGLDESFSPGMFEDDDLAMSVRRAGLRVAVALGVYVHHVGGATFRSMSPAEYVETFERGRLRFERKWGVRWSPPLPG